jgi:anti-sigma regulatory factor (Ser/Thr protein kinase)
MADRMTSFEDPGSFRLSLAPYPGAPREARRALAGMSSPLDEDLAERADLVVSELVTNSLKYADVGQSDRIELSVSVRPALLRIEVTDPGNGFEPVALRPGREDDVGGWGLWVVDQMTDRWGVDFSHSTHVWCEFDRP